MLGPLLPDLRPPFITVWDCAITEPSCTHSGLQRFKGDDSIKSGRMACEGSRNKIRARYLVR